jgi:hypothetical protein
MAARPNGRFPNRVLWLIFRCRECCRRHLC